jgi:hypothetical protein
MVGAAERAARDPCQKRNVHAGTRLPRILRDSRDSQHLFAVQRWATFYVREVENILRSRSGEYSTFAKWRIFYVLEVENILRFGGREYSTFAKLGIFYVREVGNILRSRSWEYSTFRR